MIPILTAKAWHEKNVGNFEAALGEYLRDHFVWSSPTEFIMASPVRVEDRDVYFGDGEPNAWFVYLAAGSNPFRRFLEIAPRDYEWLAWRRHNQPRYNVWRTERFKRKVGY